MTRYKSSWVLFQNAGQLIERPAEKCAFQKANRIACEFLNNKALGTVNHHNFSFLSHQGQCYITWYINTAYLNEACILLLYIFFKQKVFNILLLII